MSEAPSTTRQQQHKKSDIFVQLFAGGYAQYYLHYFSVAGALAAGSTHPMDTLRTRLQSSQKQTSIAQVQQQKSYFRTYNYLANTYKNEGMASLYRGLTPVMMAIVPSRAIYFATYTRTKV